MTRRRDTITCQYLAESPRLGGLRPLVDEVLDTVRTDCSECHAQDRDPIGLYRPVVVRPRGGRVTIECEACGRTFDYG
jgi:hypothetical protein